MKNLIYVLMAVLIAGCLHPGTTDSKGPDKLLDSGAIIWPTKPDSLAPSTMHRFGVSKRVLLNKMSDNGVWVASANPGDTLVLQSKQNPFSYIYLAGLKNVTLIDDGAAINITAGISMRDCNGITIRSSDSNKVRFAFNIVSTTGGSSGVAIEGYSKNIKVSNFLENGLEYGIWMKNEHFCDSMLQYHVIDSCEFSHFVMMNLRQHGTYIGATEQQNVTRPALCDGVNKFFNPSRIGNVKIHDGIIHNVGKNGIMISDARVGMSEVYNMDIDSTGSALDFAQGHGIASGGSTSINIHDNVINNTWLGGIAVFGGKRVIVANNKIGLTGTDPITKKKSGWCEPIRSIVAADMPFRCNIFIFNNIIGKGTTGLKDIGIYKGNYDSVVVCNNGTASMSADNNVTVLNNCPTPTPPGPNPTPDGKVPVEMIILYKDSTWRTIKP